MESKKALLIVDMQYDFINENGSLYVKDAELLVDEIKHHIDKNNYDYIVLTQDWHPKDHISFETFSVHCVEHTRGASIHPKLLNDNYDVFRKGNNKNADSLSAFMDSLNNPTGLNILLDNNNITSVYIVGVALEYCIKETAQSAKQYGYDTYVIQSLTKPFSNDNDTINELSNMGINIME